MKYRAMNAQVYARVKTWLLDAGLKTTRQHVVDHVGEHCEMIGYDDSRDYTAADVDMLTKHVKSVIREQLVEV